MGREHHRKEKKYQQAKDQGANWKGPGSPSLTQPVDESLDSCEKVMWALGNVRAEHKEKTFTQPSGNVWRAQRSGELSPGLIMPWQYRLAPGNLEDREAPVPFCHRYCITGWHRVNFRVLSLASSRSQQPPVGDAMMRAGGSREAERSQKMARVRAIREYPELQEPSDQGSIAGRSQFWLHIQTVSLTCFLLLLL